MSKFEPLFPELNSKKSSKSSRKTKKQLDFEKKQMEEKIGKENLSKLDAMVVPLLLFKASQNKNEWLVNSANIVLENPHRLNEKWINSLNKWASDTSEAMSLDQPELEEKKRYDFDNLRVFKVIEPKENQAFPSYALISIDKNGWKYYFKSNKAFGLEANSVISFRATVKGHDEGITFLSRASNIKVEKPVFNLNNNQNGDSND